MKFKLKMFMISLIVIVISLIPLSSYAKTLSKKVEVPLTKEYKSAKFDITLEYNDGYNIKVIAPTGAEYDATFTSDLHAECVVEDVKAGQWEVIVTYDFEESESTVETDETEEETLGEETDVMIRDISPIKVKVEGATESLVSVDKDITVAADIAGLKMYFKDDNFVAEWTDTTVGTVNIEVVNAKNLQKIGSASVRELHYECPIDASVEEILVNIVPAVSSSVQGAEDTYTFKVDNHPDATVTYENIQITNHETLGVTCRLNESYSVLILVNNREFERSEPLKVGEYEFNVPIEPGTNNIITYIVDDAGNMRSTSYMVEKDVVAPRLELVSTYQDIVTQDEMITIEGAVDDYDFLFINKTQIEVEGDNTFKYEYKLKEGTNNIAVIASDIAGNETEYDIVVERVIPKEEPIPWLKIIIIASLIGLAGLYIFELIRRRNNGGDDESSAPGSRLANRKNGRRNVSYEKTGVTLPQLLDNDKKELLWDVGAFIIPIIVAIIVMNKVILVGTVMSGSMEPKLKTGNSEFYNRLAYVLNEPERGDVVIFWSEEMGEYMGKRIIGMPGDHIVFKDGYVVINDQYCDESDYIASDIETNCTKVFDVPDGCYFMLGDNRAYSYDSRYWEKPYIPRENIMGRYMGQLDFSLAYILGHLKD